MIVVDASVAVDVVLRTELGFQITHPLLEDSTLSCPHLIDVEVTHALRRMVLSGELADARAERALTDFSDLPLQRFSHELLLPEVWRLRHKVTAYDAVYVALADMLSAPLWTSDLRLARAVENLIPVRTWQEDETDGSG